MLPIILAGIDDVFNSLLYGAGAWIGFLILLTLVVGLTFAWKYMGILTLFASILIGINYLDNQLGWQGLGMFLTGIFIIGKLAVEAKRG